MGKITKNILIISIISLFSGAILLGAGYATGGVQAIQQITAPTKKAETLTDISDIHLDTYSHVTVQTGNVDKPTVSYYKDSKFIADVGLTVKDKTLTLTSKDRSNTVVGAIEVFGYLLNEARRSSPFNDIIVTLPKGTTINTIQGSGLSGLSLNNLEVKTIDYSAQTDLYNTTISGGKISGLFNAYDCTLKDLTIESNYSYSSISNSSLENVTIVNEGGGNTISNSTLKNCSFSNGQTVEEIEAEFAEDKEDSNQDYYYHSHYATIGLENTTLIGDNSFTAATLDITVDLATDSKNKTSLDIQSADSNITLNGNFKTLTPVKENGKTTLTHTAKDATGKLIIRSNYGTISIK